MTALLALASALVFGGSDFAGGLAARRDNAFRVAAVAQLWSGATAVILAVAVTSHGLRTADIVGGLVAGLSGTFTFVCFYRALSLGAMSVVAPTTALVAAIIPAGVDIGRGEDLSGSTLVGIVFAVVAIGLVASGGGHDDGERVATPASAFVLAIVAGLGFAIFLLALAETNDDAGMWPLVFSRLVSLPVVCVMAVAFAGRILPHDRQTHALAITTGVTEMLANALVVLALRRGPVAVASVFGSLYPVSTGLLAWLLLRERVSRAQMVGVVIAAAALVLVAS